MTKFNLQSLSFALIVLFSVLMGRSEGGLGEEILASQREVVRSSLTARLAEPHTISVSDNHPAEPRNPVIDPQNKIILFVQPELSWKRIPPPKIQATAFSVKEIGGTGSSIIRKEASNRWPMASLTKLITALVAWEHIKHDQKIVITERAVRTEGLAGYFKIGELFAAHELIKTSLVISSNDAAVALADFYGYGEFVQLMRAKLSDLKMFDTTIVDPAGLSILNQSTLNDLEKLINYILKNHPQIFEATAKAGIDILELKSGKTRTIPANNMFAGRPDFIGGKTGYLDAVGGNLISLFEYRNQKFLIIILGSKDRFKETEKIYGWLKTNF